MKLFKFCICLCFLFAENSIAQKNYQAIMSKVNEQNNVYFNGQCCNLKLPKSQIKNGKMSSKIFVHKDVVTSINGLTVNIKGREIKVKGDKLNNEANLAVERLRMGDIILISDILIDTKPKISGTICKIPPIIIEVK
jgi:predicted GNAT family acetyltransferase